MAKTQRALLTKRIGLGSKKASTGKNITRKHKKRTGTLHKRGERKGSDNSERSEMMRQRRTTSENSEEGQRDTDRRVNRRGERKGSDMSDRSERDRQSTDRSSVDRDRKKAVQRGVKPFVDRNVFNDPFFTEPWQDLFNFSSFGDLIDRAKNTAQSAVRNASRLARNVDTSYPGSYTTKSFYRNISAGDARPEKREVVSQETTTNVDSKGRKFVENWKNFEHGDHKKTIHSKMIDDKGIKEMRTHDIKSGEEFEHVDYRKLSDKDLHNFNSEFERGIRNVKSSFPAMSSFSNLLPGLNLHSDFSSPRMLGQTSTEDRKSWKIPEFDQGSRTLPADTRGSKR